MVFDGRVTDPDNFVAPETLLQFLAIAQLLNDCLIKKTFVLPDSLVRPIILTEAGNDRLQKLRERPRIKPNDAKMAVALQFGWDDELFISDRTDIPALRREITAEMSRNGIRFPFIYGRELHDAIADAFPHKARLDVRETDFVLSRTGSGVFQCADTVVGAFGCIGVREKRALPATRDVPAFRCRDHRCMAIHDVELTTPDSSIAKARDKLTEILEASGMKSSSLPDQIMEQFSAYLGGFDTNSEEGLIDLLADALTLDETRAVVAICIRARCKEEGGRAGLQRDLSVVVTDPEAFVGSLQLPELLSLILYFTDGELTAAVDRALDDAALSIPAGSVRTSQIHRHMHPPQRLELGRLGLRRVTRDTSPVGALRLAYLARAVATDPSVDHDDIAYSLDLPNGSTPDQIARHAYSERDTMSVVDSVLLASRSAARCTAALLHLDPYLDHERAELRRRVAWRLGVTNGDTNQDDLHRASAELASLRAGVSGKLGEGAIRGLIANFFVSFETSLLSAVRFSTWAFSVDHFAAVDGFSVDVSEPYNPDDFLDLTGTRGSDRLCDSLEKPTLGELSSFFGRLAKRLESLDPNDYERPREQFPLVCRQTGRPFAFAHSVPFLDLSQDSQSQIIEELRAVARLSRNDSVLGVRNAGLHGNSEFPDAQMLDECVTRVNDVLSTLEGLGFAPRIYSRGAATIDADGKGTVEYAAAHQRVSIPVGSWTSARRLPVDNDELVILPGAVMDDVGALRFAVRANRGPKEYWKGWPVRWPAETTYSKADVPEVPEEGSALLG